jgi:hypothetical protein
LSHFSKRGASSSKNSAREMPQDKKPSDKAFSFIEFVYVDLEFRILMFDVGCLMFVLGV